MKDFGFVALADARTTNNWLNPLMNGLVAYANGGKRGPQALDARLVLVAPRPSVAKKPRRKKKQQSIWYIVDGDKRQSTRATEHEHEKAQLALTIYNQCKSEALRGAHLPGLLSFEEILADHCAHLRNSARTPSTIHAANKAESMARTLLKQHFSDHLIGSYTPQDSHDFKSKLVAIRDAAHVAKGREPQDEEPEQYACQCLALLRTATSKYPGRHSQFWRMDIVIPKKRSRRKRRDWLRKYQVARLLLACMGYVWDWENWCWKTKLVQRPDGSWYHTRRVATAETANLRRGIGRLIRLILRTGLRHDAALKMKWGRWDDLGGIVFRNADGDGTIFRRGYDEYNTGKSLNPSEIFEELKALLRIWAKQDGYIDELTGTVKSRAIQPFLIRDKDNKAYGKYALKEFRQICEWAGLDEKTSVHALKTTAATWCRQKGFEIGAIAEMLDTSPETLRRYYIHLSDETTRTAVEEFNDRGKRQKFRQLVHNQPDADDPVRQRDLPNGKIHDGSS